MKLYDLPLKFDALTKKNETQRECSLEQSIANNISLIIGSKYHEHRFDESYGCEIWDLDFELVFNENVWKEKVRKSIEGSLKKHETRLENIQVDITVDEEEVMDPKTKIRALRKCLSIKLTSNIKENGNYFPGNTKLFLSPISVD